MGDVKDSSGGSRERVEQLFAFVHEQQIAVREYESHMDLHASFMEQPPEALLGEGYPIAPNVTNRIFVRCRGPLCLHDQAGAPLAHTEYLLNLDGKVVRGLTDGSGWITWFDPSGIKQAELYVGNTGYTLEFGDYSGESVVGGQAMLNARGFNAGPLDGKAGDRTKSATAYFQMQCGLAVTGELDAATVARLEADCHVVLT